MPSHNDADGQEETTNEIAIILSKRMRKYHRMMHGQHCSDNCGCCPDLNPPKVPGPNESDLLITYNSSAFCIYCNNAYSKITV